MDAAIVVQSDCSQERLIIRRSNASAFNPEQYKELLFSIAWESRVILLEESEIRNLVKLLQHWLKTNELKLP